MGRLSSGWEVTQVPPRAGSRAVGNLGLSGVWVRLGLLSLLMEFGKEHFTGPVQTHRIYFCWFCPEDIAQDVIYHTTR